MLFTIVIHQEGDSAYGVTVPDMPGCFSAGDTLEEALENVREAIDLHMEEVVAGNEPVPSPSPMHQVAGDPEHAGATFFLVDVDMSKYLGKAEKINITLPRYLLERIDRAVKEGRFKSRSGMLAEGALDKLSRLP
ncbi:type II toxin-antitoxin system HicB family antitoxin [Halomonas sp. HK25]|uniref:type II toxin-antitoxin system HicB family antitoxin n=1 Tax=Halomonas sp. HK25 TaxID=3394321 RepID=UPI0039FDA3E9